MCECVLCVCGSTTVQQEVVWAYDSTFIAVNSQALVIAVPLGTLAYKLRQLEVRPNLVLQYITYGWSTAWRTAALHSHLIQLSSQHSNLRLFPKTLEIQHGHVFDGIN